MSTLQDVIDEIRMEYPDGDATRWTEAQALRIIGKAARRISHILYRNDIPGGRIVTTYTTSPTVDSYALPADFMAPYGLYRDGQHKRIQQENEDSWAILSAPVELGHWLVRGDNFLVSAAPTSAESLTLVYWPLYDITVTKAWTASDEMPWGGKFDDIIAEYAALRLKNIDEMDAGFDAQLLQDLENNILNTYASVDPSTVTRRGWLV